MRRIALLAIVALLLFPLLAAPARAQATRTWVSGVGDDANPCSRTAPCKTFAGAISKTAAAGEINCLDPGGFGAVTVTKSITISCEAGTAGVLVSGTNGIVFAGGASDFLYIKGLDFEGVSKSGLNAILMNSGALLHVEDCSIRNFSGSGILIQPSNSATFVVNRTTLFNNGNGATGAGILIRPTSGGTTGVIDGVVADRNVFGIAADGTGGAAGINVTVSGSSVNGSAQAGIVAASGGAGAGVMLMRTAASNNAIGLLAAGGGAVMRVGETQITGNGTGVSGNVLSYGTNQLNGNAVDGSLSPVPGGLH
jgi:hypothetical protein